MSRRMLHEALSQALNRCETGTQARSPVFVRDRRARWSRWPGVRGLLDGPASSRRTRRRSGRGTSAPAPRSWGGCAGTCAQLAATGRDVRPRPPGARRRAQGRSLRAMKPAQRVAFASRGRPFAAPRGKSVPSVPPAAAGRRSPVARVHLVGAGWLPPTMLPAHVLAPGLGTRVHDACWLRARDGVHAAQRCCWQEYY